VRVLVIGGGRVGSYLARQLVGQGHTVAVIEPVRARAEEIVADAKVLVFEGDGTDIELLRAAGVERADWVVAVTGRDEENLVAAQLAMTLGARRALARMNDPTNKATFDALGIQVVAVTDLMAKIISREVEVPDLQSHDLFAGGRVEVLELEVPPTFEPQRVADLTFPPDSVLVFVVRGDEVIFPRGDTLIRFGDRVLVACRVEQVGRVRRAFGLERNAP